MAYIYYFYKGTITIHVMTTISIEISCAGAHGVSGVVVTVKRVPEKDRRTSVKLHLMLITERYWIRISTGLLTCQISPRIRVMSFTILASIKGWIIRNPIRILLFSFMTISVAGWWNVITCRELWWIHTKAATTFQSWWSSSFSTNCGHLHMKEM